MSNDFAHALAAARAHLDRTVASGNSATALEPEVADAIAALSLFVTNNDVSGAAELEARYVLGWLHWRRHLALGDADGLIDQLAALMDLQPCFVAAVEPLPGPLLPWLASSATDAAEDLLRRAAESGDSDLISAAIGLWQRIVETPDPVHPEDGAMHWSNLGVALMARFAQAGAEADLETAIDAYRTAVDRTPDAGIDRARYLGNLAGALLTRARHTGSAADLAEATAFGAEATGIDADGDDDRVEHLSNHGNSLLARHEITGQDADLAAAIDTFRDALGSTADDDPRQAAVLTNLGSALLRRAELTGSATDLDQAVEACRRSVGTTAAGDPDLGKRLANLGVVLRTRFARSQKAADLDEAIISTERALSALGPDQPERAMVLHGLGAALHARFMQTGVLADLDAAIDALRSGADALPESHGDRGGYTANLGGFLMTRYQWTGGTADLDAAIALGRQAAATIPVGHVHRPMVLAFLGTALTERGEQPGAGREILDEAVDFGAMAVAATPPGHQDRSIYLNALATSLGQRSRLTGSAEDLDQAIELCREAAAAAPAGTPGRAGMLSNLSSFLRARSERTGSSSDLNAALAVTYQALDTVPRDHHTRAMFLCNAGHCLREESARTGSRKSLRLAMRMYRMAAGVSSATPSVRIDAARSAAALLAGKRPREAAGLLVEAVRLLPEVAPRQLGRSDQQHKLGEFAGLAADAAALVLADPRRRPARPERAALALALLEHGRGILLSQALDTRNDLTTLEELRPELADRYRRLRDILDQPAAGDAGPPLGDPASGWQKLDVPDRHRQASEFAATVAEIRALDGLGRFMLPPTLAELLTAAMQGGTVVFNVSEYRSDALLIHPAFIDHLPLPNLTAAALRHQVGLFQRAQQLRKAGPADAADGPDPDDTLLGILEWLWDVAAGPALEALGYRDLPGPWGWFQVQWIAGGLLGQLPIHAAGYHRDGAADGPPRTVLDRVISSYAPTIRALHDARTPAVAAARPMRSLIVAMPSTPGVDQAGDLPGVAEQAAWLQTTLPGATLLMQRPEGDNAAGAVVSGTPTSAEVLARLPGCAIAHFACHGTTDPVDPSRSGLLLSDHGSAPFTVARLAPVRLDAAGLAYLSACSTALNEAVDLADESIHLTSAFQLAGFPHVVGTLWEVDEQVAEAVAESFYSRLRTDAGGLELGQAAETLHHIVRLLRDEERDKPFTWAAYLHAGA